MKIYSEIIMRAKCGSGLSRLCHVMHVNQLLGPTWLQLFMLCQPKSRFMRAGLAQCYFVSKCGSRMPRSTLTSLKGQTSYDFEFFLQAR